MILRSPFISYPGGKSGNGTYQAIINHIPSHRLFLSLFLGNCGVTRFIKPAQFSILNDLDPSVIKAWKTLGLNPNEYQFLNKPALDILKELDSNNWRFGFNGAADYFIYLDPPYKLVSRKSKKKLYCFEMSDSDHLDLLSKVYAMSAKGFKIMVSHYPDELYDDVLSTWNTVDFNSMTRKGLVTERIYMNYVLNGELHDYRYIGANFRERESNNRIRNNIIKKMDSLSPVLRNSILSDIASHYSLILQLNK